MVIFSLENKFLRRWLWQKRLEIWLWCLEMISIQIMMGMIQLLSILMVNTLILLLQEYCYLPAAGCKSGQHQQDWYYSDKLLICRTEAGPSRRLLPAHLVCNLPILVSKEAGWGGGRGWNYQKLSTTASLHQRNLNIRWKWNLLYSLWLSSTGPRWWSLWWFFVTPRPQWWRWGVILIITPGRTTRLAWHEVGEGE